MDIETERTGEADDGAYSDDGTTEAVNRMREALTLQVVDAEELAAAHRATTRAVEMRDDLTRVRYRLAQTAERAGNAERRAEEAVRRGHALARALTEARVQHADELNRLRRCHAEELANLRPNDPERTV